MKAQQVQRPGSRFKMKIVEPDTSLEMGLAHKFTWVLAALDSFAEDGWQEIGIQYTTERQLMILYRRKGG